MGAAYKRVEPDYRSLGTYFFNNDLENYTLNLGFGLFNDKVKINATTGIQRNNLFDEKATQLSRNISSLYVNYLHRSLNLGFHYSNYSSEVSFTLNPDLDSLNAIIVTQSLGLNGNYSIVNDSRDRHILSFSFALQDVTDDVEEVNRSAESKMINTIFSYRYLPDQSVWKFRGLINYNRNELNNLLINRLGLGFGVDRELVENKLSASLSSIFYNSTGENIDNQTLNLKFSLPYKIDRNRRLNFRLLYLHRLNNNPNTTLDFQEITTVLNYTHSF